jgi:hypothetical protein
MACYQRSIAAAIFLLSLGISPSFGQATDANVLGSLKKLKCSFPLATTGAWKDGVPQAQVRNQEMTLEFDEIDTQEASARVIGTSGPAHVTANLSAWSLYFMDVGPGYLNTTTVFSQETAPKKLKAVHSRYGYLQMSLGRYVSEPIVSQSYGDCAIVE